MSDASSRNATNAAGSTPAAHVLIVGLGNVLVMDDGVGVHAARALQADPPPGSTVVEVGTAVLDALPLLEEAELVIAIDAIHGGAAPGTIYRVDPTQLDDRVTGASLHELDLRAALRLLPPARRPTVIALGVEPACLDYGMELSPVVQAALPALLDEVRRIAAHRLGRDRV